jgi:glycosyltransferase involved in cell wall biosynthesis
MDDTGAQRSGFFPENLRRAGTARRFRVPEERVAIIYPGIDLDEYDRPNAYENAGVGLIPGTAPEHKVVMYVGSIVHPNQGLPILSNALPQVFRAAPEARCVLVGALPRRPSAIARRSVRTAIG